MDYLIHMFGKRIKELRKAAGLKQSDLAHMLGVSRPNISFWENAQYPPLEAITRICKALEIDITEFFMTENMKSMPGRINPDLLMLIERMLKLNGDTLKNILDIFYVILEKYEIMHTYSLLSSLNAGDSGQFEHDTPDVSNQTLLLYEENTDSHHRLPYYARHAGKIALEHYFKSLAWLSN